MQRPSTRVLYLLLAVLFALTLASQVPFTIDVVRTLEGSYVQRPIGMRGNVPVLDGDPVLSVEGQPLRGTHDVTRVLHEHRPGDVVAIAVQHRGQTVERRVQLKRYLQSTWFAVVCFLVLPWLSIPLGFWVAALRPRDLCAWLVLGILVGLSQLIRSSSIDLHAWPLPIAVPGWLFHVLALNAWAPCMTLFGVYFPHRWRADERVPWAKWVLLAPLVYTALADCTLDAARFWNLSATGWLPPLPAWLQLVPMSIALSLFFVGISFKFREPDLPADDRRRLRMLHAGGTAAMTPFFLVWMYSLIVLHRQDPPDSPVIAIALAAFVLLPLTMAYVIVVERAMDVRMVIRQGLMYALAQRGVFVMRVVVTTLVLFAAISAANTTGVRQPVRIAMISLGIVGVFAIRKAAARARVWIDRRFFREAYNAEQILGELSEQVRGILDRESLLETVCRRISESLHVDRIAVLLRQDGFFRPALATGYPAPLEIAVPGDSEPGADALARMDSRLLLPLPSRKELLGYISLGPKKSEEPYTPSDSRLLRTVAAQTGLALENSRLSEAIAAEIAQRETLHREIEIAREVQQRLFPQSLPEVAALHYAGHCRPARGVGGDYYDFLALASGRLGLAIADISGKGIPAALLMASLQASVRGQSQAGGNVAELMTQVNRLVYDASPENRYATFFYAQFDPATRRLVYTNGGHNAPILLRGREVLRLETGGPVVGLFRASRYEQEEIQLLAGDLLVLYTDGISEAENPREEEWGEPALIESASACRELPPNEMISRIMQAADAFAAGAPQHDDMTLVVAKVCE